MRIFWSHILRGVPLLLTDCFQASTWVSVIAQKYIYIFLLLVLLQPSDENRSSKQKGIAFFTFGLLFCFVRIANDGAQRVDSLCAELFPITVLRFVELAVSCSINGLVLSGIGVIDPGFAPLVGISHDS